MEGGRCCRGQGFALPPLGRLPPKMILRVFFTLFGPKLPPSRRPPRAGAGGPASRAFPFPAATHVRDEIKRLPTPALQGPAQGGLSGLCFASAVMGADSMGAWAMGSQGSVLLLLGGGVSIPPHPSTATGVLGLGAGAALQTQPAPPAHPWHRPLPPLTALVLFTWHVCLCCGN